MTRNEAQIQAQQLSIKEKCSVCILVKTRDLQGTATDYAIKKESEVDLNNEIPEVTISITRR